MAETEKTAPVLYRGGSADGVFLDAAPAVFHTHGQRELWGTDPEAPLELYRNRGEQDVTVVAPGEDGEPVEQRVRAVVFEFESAATQARLDSDMNPLEGAPTS